jgi:hypothetical protein
VKTIIKIQLKLLKSEYGNVMYFMPLLQLGKAFYYFILYSVFGIMAWQLIEKKYLTVSAYEQLAIIMTFLFGFFLKKEKPFVWIPYITKLTVSKIRNYILMKDLLSGYNFILIPLSIAVAVLLNTVENSGAAYAFLFVRLWLMGVFLNLLARIIKYLCIGCRVLLIAIITILTGYAIFLVLLYKIPTAFLFSNIIADSRHIIILIAAIALLIPFYFYVIKQEMYYMYDGNHLKQNNVRRFNTRFTSSNIFTKLLVLEYFRCGLFNKFSLAIFSRIFGGVMFYVYFDFKLIGLALIVSSYTFAMIPYTIYLSSNYFDGLYTKPVSIKAILSSSFYIHVFVTTVIFLIMLAFFAIYDKSYILSLVALYLFTAGAMAFMLLYNILFAKRFELFPAQEFKIKNTFMQTLIGIIASAFLLACVAVINYFPSVGSYIIISISIAIVMAHPLWIDYLFGKLMQRRYWIMENLRKKQ